MTPARLATELGILDKTLRRFLRRRFPRHPGDHGSAWSLTSQQIEVTRANFGNGRHAAPATVRQPKPASPNLIAAKKPTARPAPLRCYVRPGLDVLFVALNPPTQSASNGHWFSGTQSGFFKLLYKSGLITADVPKATADELIFGGTAFNHQGASYGVTDLRPELVEVNSGKVAVGGAHVEEFIRVVRKNEPRIVCIIHSKVWEVFNKLVGRRFGVIDVTAVGRFTRPLSDCRSQFICNYFPNGNNIPDQVKINIFAQVRGAI